MVQMNVKQILCALPPRCQHARENLVEYNFSTSREWASCTHRIAYPENADIPCPVQKQDDCWWFGKPGLCGTWAVFIAVYCIFAASDFAAVIVILLLGTEKSGQSNRMRRY